MISIDSGNADFKATFSSGGNVKQIEITSEIEWMESKATRVLRLDISGVDLLFENDHF